MNRRKCKNCGCMFSPRKHVKGQKYCSKDRCQKARKNKWMRDKLRHDMDYKINQKGAQHRWLAKNPDYLARYQDSKKIEGKLTQSSSRRKINPINSPFKKPFLKLSITKGILFKLRKKKKIGCGCNLILKG
jgi:hypothetical protein